MNNKLLAITTLGLAALLPTQQAMAHISYKDIQTYSQSANPDGSITYNVVGLTMTNGAWANATDANWGNTHDVPWMKFEITNPGGAYINLTVARDAISDELRTNVFNDFLGPDPYRVTSQVNVINDLTPAFTLYKGLLPNGTHDGATQLPGKEGVWQALADTTGGNGLGDVYDYHAIETIDPETGVVIGSEPSGEPTFLYNDPGEVATIQYLAHAGALNGTAASVSLENIFLAPGSYSVALGGTNYESYPHFERLDPTSPNYDPNYENLLIDIENAAYQFRGFNLALNVTPVPVPAAIWFMGSGLLGLLGMRGGSALGNLKTNS